MDSDDSESDYYSLTELLNISHHGHPRDAFEDDTVITDVYHAPDHFHAMDELRRQAQHQAASTIMRYMVKYMSKGFHALPK